MTSQVESILRALFDDAGALPTSYCAPCQDQLAAYVDAQLAGEDAAARFSSVGAHLADCETCRLVYEELNALLLLEQSGGLAAPPLPATFDFGYLESRPALAEPEAQPSTGRAWRLDDLGRLIVRLTEDMLRGLQGPALQPSYLKSGAPQPVTCVVAGELDDLDLRLVVEPARGTARAFDIEVEVDVPSRGGWPNLAGSTVALLVDGDEVAREETDAFGKVLFEDVAADALASVEFRIEAAE